MPGRIFIFVLCLISAFSVYAEDVLPAETDSAGSASSSPIASASGAISEDSFDRNEWRHLERLNYQPEYAFEEELPISGIGIVTITGLCEVQDKNLTIYDDKGRKLATVKCSQENVVTKFKGKTYDRDSTDNPFDPRLFIVSPDYFRLAFDCLGFDKEYYRVEIDHKTGETGRIKKNDPLFKYQSIEKFVDDWAGNGIDFDRSTNPLRQLPKDNAELISHRQEARYKIWSANKISLKGDWLQVRTYDNETGWIRWRQGNKILIRLYYAC